MSNQKNNVIGKAKLFNKSNYNSFDLSHRNCFTNTTGAIIPCYVGDVLPTEKVSLNIGWFSRAQTLVTNSYGRFVENVQAFYVPYSSIYRNFTQNAITSALSNAKGDNECRISDGFGVKQPLNDGNLPRLYLSDVFEWLFYLAIYETVYASYVAAMQNEHNMGIPASKIKILSRTYMTRSMSIALLLENLGYGSFSLFTDPQYRMSPITLPSSMQPFVDKDKPKLTITPLNFGEIFPGGADLACQLWHQWRNAYAVGVSPMRLAAYHKVYNDYYRNDTWQPYESETCNFDYLFATLYKVVDFPWSKYVSTTSSTWDAKMDGVVKSCFTATTSDDLKAILDELDKFIDDNVEQKQWFADYNIFDMRCCNLPLDSVNGVLPSPQYGADSKVAISEVNWGPTLDNGSPLNDLPLALHGKNVSPIVGQGKLGVQTTNGTQQATLNFSVRDMRIAESLQKFKEISISNDNYFIDQIKAHFGEAPLFDPFKTYFIGGKSTIMQVDTQVNQNLAGDNNATLGGLASAQGNFTANYKADDYGCIIVLHSIYPLVDYPNDGIEESLLCTSASKLPVPEFDNNGFEGVRNIYNRGVDPFNYTKLYGTDKNPLGVYGYGARYYSWKTTKDVVNGDFKYGLRDKVMGYNSLKSSFGLVENTLYATPRLTDQIFANQNHSSVSDDQFYVNMNVGCSMLRPFSVHGLPFAN